LGGIRRSYKQQESWEDKAESFRQNTNPNSLAMMQLLPQDFDPSKPPPMAAMVPSDGTLVEGRMGPWLLWIKDGCKMCDVKSFNSKKQAIGHYDGKRHKKLMKLKLVPLPPGDPA
jgi:hypothetical protein